MDINSVRKDFEKAAGSKGADDPLFAMNFATNVYFMPHTQSLWEGYVLAMNQALNNAIVVKASLVEALTYYADGHHFTRHDPAAWDTVSGEPPNFYEDESNTATVEDGSVAKQALKLIEVPS